jgi:hypothetical protein
MDAVCVPKDAISKNYELQQQFKKLAFVRRKDEQQCCCAAFRRRSSDMSRATPTRGCSCRSQRADRTKEMSFPFP